MSGHGTRRRPDALLVVVALGLMLMLTTARGEEPARPAPTLPGVTPAGKVLLPNGWSLKPAGSQTVLGDFSEDTHPHAAQRLRGRTALQRRRDGRAGRPAKSRDARLLAPAGRAGGFLEQH